MMERSPPFTTTRWRAGSSASPVFEPLLMAGDRPGHRRHRDPDVPADLRAGRGHSMNAAATIVRRTAARARGDRARHARERVATCCTKPRGGDSDWLGALRALHARASRRAELRSNALARRLPAGQPTARSGVPLCARRPTARSSTTRSAPFELQACAGRAFALVSWAWRTAWTSRRCLAASRRTGRRSTLITDSTHADAPASRVEEISLKTIASDDEPGGAPGELDAVRRAQERRQRHPPREPTPTAWSIKYRIDGVLVAAQRSTASSMAEQVISRIKVMAELDIAERRIPQDGRFKVAHRRPRDRLPRVGHAEHLRRRRGAAYSRQAALSTDSMQRPDARSLGFDADDACARSASWRASPTACCW